jgi:lipoate-protein ligase A
VYQSTSKDPIFNLAVEEWLFNDVLKVDEHHQILYLWQNGPAVVIGKHQNPWKECDLPAMEKDGVTLVRRYSGGGAVYHDLGNGVFTFISPKTDYDYKRNLGIVTSALKKVRVPAEVTGRNDISVEGRKISGSAFKNAKDRTIHHGTFLFDVNLAALTKYLTPSKAKLLSKGVTSAAARVTNIRAVNPDATFEGVNEALVEEFVAAYGGIDAEIEEVSPNKALNNAALAKYYNELSEWKWRYGHTPEFEHYVKTRFDWGQFDVHLQSKSGKIDQVKIFSDSLNPGLVEELEKNLIGVEYSRKGVEEATEKARMALKRSVDHAADEHIDQFRDWLVGEL